jgi:prepilin-type N-terminal cleavage/methylation domain-containing protein
MRRHGVTIAETAGASGAVRRGFTGMELLVVIAIIAVLLCLLLPAVQAARESARRGMTTRKLQEIRIEVDAYKQQHGRFPASLVQLEFEAFSWSDGKDEGYVFELKLTPGGYQVTAAPAVPGITGNTTFVMSNVGEVKEFPTPGSDENRAKMFAELKAMFARRVAEVIALDPTGEVGKAAPLFVRDPKNVKAAFDAWDANRDGVVSAAEIFDEKRWQDLPYISRTVAEAREIMHIGAGDEDVGRIPGDLDFQHLEGDPGALWDYSGLKALVETFATNDGTAESLSAILDHAVRAARRGDDAKHDKLLEQFQKKVMAQAGKGLSDEDADVLIAISDGLF